MYVYCKSGSAVYTVGYFSPDGRFHAESDYSHKDQAAARVHYLNGGIGDQQLSLIVDQLASWLADICEAIKSLKCGGKNG